MSTPVNFSAEGVTVSLFFWLLLQLSVAFKNVLEIGFQIFSQHTVACGQNWMIYYKHFTRKLMLRYFFSSVLWYGFQECLLSGEVIKNLPMPSDKSSYRSNFLKPIFQSISQIWVKYLKIEVWMEFYKCLRSAKKVKECCQVFSWWVNAHVCCKRPQLPKAEWEKPARRPVL